MENSQSLATDSFSYSWLVNSKPSFDGLLESLRPSLDIPNDSVSIVHHLNRIGKEDQQDFDFDVRPGSSRPSFTLVPADEIFSDGCIMPVYRQKLPTHSRSIPASPFSQATSTGAAAAGRDCSGYDRGRLEKCEKAQNNNNALQRWLELLKPIYEGMGCSRKSTRVDDLERKVLEVRSRSNSVQASPDHHHRRSNVWAAASSQTISSNGSSIPAGMRPGRNPQLLRASPTRSHSLQASPDRRSSNRAAALKQIGSKVYERLSSPPPASQARSHSLQASPNRNNCAVLKQSRNTVRKRHKNSPQVSPAQSPTHYSNDAWYSESSIHEAILHCKRSIAN